MGYIKLKNNQGWNEISGLELNFWAGISLIESEILSSIHRHPTWGTLNLKKSGLELNFQAGIKFLGWN